MLNNLYFKNGNRAIILFHAYTGSPNDVRTLARRLEREGYSVYTPLFSGHGTHEPMDILSKTPLDWEKDARDAVSFLEEQGHTEIATFGLSMGGVFAMDLLSQYSEKIIGGGSFSSPLIASRSTNIYPNFMKYCEQLFQKRELSQEEVQERLNNIEEPLETQIKAVRKVTQRVTESLQTITQPVYLAQSGKDYMVDADSVYEAGQLLTRSPHEIHWYPNSMHVITVSVERQQFEKDVIAFVNKLPWKEE